MYLSSIAPSGPPSLFEATVLSSTAISFLWEPPSPENRNGIIRQYIIVLDSGQIETTIRTFSTGTSLTVTNLQPYTLYQCTIAAETVAIGVESEIYPATTYETG